MSGPRFVDRLKLTSATTGTGTLTAATASGAWNALSKIADGDWGFFTAAQQSGSLWETFAGTVGGSGTTITRDTVLDGSSGPGVLVNFSGALDVFQDVPGIAITRVNEAPRSFVPTFFA